MAKEKPTPELYATHNSDKTPLYIGDIEIPAYVLNNGMRVFSQNGMQKALGYFGTAGNWLPNFVSSKQISPYISSGLLEALSNRVEFRRSGEGGSVSTTYGYDVTILIDICDAIIDLKNSGRELSDTYKDYAKRAEIIIRSVAKVGIVALVDEATGYQYDREKDELQKILKKYISEELLAWEKRFPDEFYREIFRLNNWVFTPPEINKTGRPGIIGTWTKKYIYSRLPPGVLDALLKKSARNEKGKLKDKLHQRLTREEGIEHLNRQIISVVTLMNISDSWKEFNRHWNKKFGQQEMSFPELDELEPKSTIKINDTHQEDEFVKNIRKGLNWNPKENKN